MDANLTKPKNVTLAFCEFLSEYGVVSAQLSVFKRSAARRLKSSMVSTPPEA